jgi:hypothetical protein
MERYRNLLTTILVVPLCFFFSIFFFLSDAESQADLLKEVAKTSLQLVAIVIIGSYAKYLLDQSAEERKKKEARRRYQMDLLNEITTNYWRIRKAIQIIDVSQTRTRYWEQIGNIIDLRIEVLKIKNNISANLYGLDESSVITRSLERMIKMLNEIIKECREKAPELLQLEKNGELDKIPAVIANLRALNKIKEDISTESFLDNIVAPIRNQINNTILKIR